jgi:hypothetical protein
MMKIDLADVTIRQLSDGYFDNAEGGVVGLAGKLDIRPPYQREFVYRDKQRDAVINSIFHDYPLALQHTPTVRVEMKRPDPLHIVDDRSMSQRAVDGDEQNGPGR